MTEQPKLNIEFEVTLYKSLSRAKKTLQSNLSKNQIKLDSINQKIREIEESIKDYKAKNLHWTKEDIYFSYGNNPTLILYFYPSTEYYLRSGDELLVEVKFSQSELDDILENIDQNQQNRQPGSLTFTRIIDFENVVKIETISTDNIYKISGHKIR